MDPSIVGIELCCLLYIAKFYVKELFCWKVTNIKMFLISASTWFGLVYHLPYLDGNPTRFVSYFFGLFGSCLCTALELTGMLHRMVYLRDFYITNVIEPEVRGYVRSEYKSISAISHSPCFPFLKDA